MSFHQVVPKIYHTYSKIWVNRDWVIRFLGFFGDFWGREPDLHSESSDFQILSVFATFWLGFLPIGTLPVSLLESPIIIFQGKNLYPSSLRFGEWHMKVFQFGPAKRKIVRTEVIYGSFQPSYHPPLPTPYIFRTLWTWGFTGEHLIPHLLKILSMLPWSGPVTFPFHFIIYDPYQHSNDSSEKKVFYMHTMFQVCLSSLAEASYTGTSLAGTSLILIFIYTGLIFGLWIDIATCDMWSHKSIYHHQGPEEFSSVLF